MNNATRATSLKALIGACVGAGYLFLTGCQSLFDTRHADDGTGFPDPANQVTELSDEERAFARAIAHFATAQMLELDQQHEAALEQYRLALQYDPDHEGTYLRVALNLIRRNKTDEAIEVLQGLSAHQPNAAQPLVWLGSAYRHEGDTDAAIRTYRTALEKAPENAGIYIQLVDLLIQRGDEQEAMDLLVQGADEADDPVDLYRVLGEMHMRRAGLSAHPDEAGESMEQAIDSFKLALEIEPDDATLLNSLGELYIRNRQFEEAIEIFERMDRLHPDDMLLKERLAHAYELAGRLKDAARVLEELAEAHPTNARIFFALAALYERLDNIEKAVLNYQLAVRLDPADPAGYLKLAVLQMEEQPEEAEAALREGLEFMPDNPHLLEMLGYVLFNQQDYGEAVMAFRQAEAEWILMEERAMTPNFHLYLALSYYFNNQPEEASETLWQAMEGSPDAMEAFAHFIFQDEDNERVGQAISIFNTLLEKNPNDAAILAMLAYVHSFRQEFEDALEAFEQAETLAEGTDDEETILNPRFYFWYAAAHERAGMHERAEELFYKCLEMDPDNVEAYNYLAYMWADNGIHLEKAKEYVLKALEQRPESGAFIDTLGWIHYRQGRYELAEEEIKRALELIPDDPTILDHLGDIYLKLDKPEKAKAKWKRAFLIDPDNEELSRKLLEYGVELEPLKIQAEEEREGVPGSSPDSMKPTLEKNDIQDATSANIPDDETTATVK